MFSLLSGLWQYLFRKDEYYVLLVGLDNAGKTVRLAPPCRPAGGAAPSSALLTLSCQRQTLLEKFKAHRHAHYRGVPPDKITPTVGLNGTAGAAGRLGAPGPPAHPTHPRPMDNKQWAARTRAGRG